MNKKIAIISDITYPYPSGVAQLTYNLYLEFKKLGYDVNIIASKKAPYCLNNKDFIYIGKTFLFPYNGTLCTLSFGWNIINQLKVTLKKYEILIIVGPLGPVLPLLSLILSEEKATKIGLFVSYFDQSILLSLSKKFLKKYFDKLSVKVAISAAARNCFYNFFPADYKIIPLGVNIEKFNKAEPIPKYKDGKFNILFVGRLEKRKGATWLINSFILAKKKSKIPMRLIIIGDGPLMPHLLKIKEEDIELLGQVENVAPYYKSCEIFCAPSLYSESFGLVLLEAMAAATPIIASDVPGYKELLKDNKIGRLIPPGDVIALSEQIIELLENKDLRASMAEAAYQHVKKYTWEATAKKLEEFF